MCHAHNAFSIGWPLSNAVWMREYVCQLYLAMGLLLAGEYTGNHQSFTAGKGRG